MHRYLALLFALAILGCGAEDGQAPEVTPETTRLTMACPNPTQLANSVKGLWYIVDVEATHEPTQDGRRKIEGKLYVQNRTTPITFTRCTSFKSEFSSWPQGETRVMRCQSLYPGRTDEIPPNIARIIFVPDGEEPKEGAQDGCTPPSIDGELRATKDYLNDY